MKRIPTAAIVVAAIAVAAFAWWLLFASHRSERTLSGYIEADTLYLAAPQPGTLRSLVAREGERVAAGQQLFTIDPEIVNAQGQQAQAQVTQAETQVTASAAAVQQARAEENAAAAELARAREHLGRLEAVRSADSAAVAGTDLDQARAAVRQANARVNAARDAVAAQQAQVGSARAQTQAARGGAREVQARLGQLSPSAPEAARVEEVFYQPGEWVPANQPVVSLLPDRRVKLRFFVPEADVQRYRPGSRVRFACDGCAAGQSAIISHVSSRPEFTPPVIFSRTSRDRLVFMVEARPDKPSALRPGLPVDVEPLP
jgi:HlyD family secretion protein